MGEIWRWKCKLVLFFWRAPGYVFTSNTVLWNDRRSCCEIFLGEWSMMEKDHCIAVMYLSSTSFFLDNNWDSFRPFFYVIRWIYPPLFLAVSFHLFSEWIWLRLNIVKCWMSIDCHCSTDCPSWFTFVLYINYFEKMVCYIVAAHSVH